MNRVQNCEVENCIPTASSCVQWNGGDIEFLGICDGDSLNSITAEIVFKLQEIAGDKLSEFDIESLIEVCGKQSPTEITILSILNLIKDNQICLKDFLDGLTEQLSLLITDKEINIDLKCYAEFDNLGNALSVNREQLDQLIINQLCINKSKIEALEGQVINLKNDIDSINTDIVVEELAIDTCINPSVLGSSLQIKNTSQALCDLRDKTGTIGNISTALSTTPGDLNTEFGLIPGWILVPNNWAANYNNLLLEVENLRKRVITIETECCSLTCDDVKLGFSVQYSGSNVLMYFTSTAGTSIPNGFIDQGSTITITDIGGNKVVYTTTTGFYITNGSTIAINVFGLTLNNKVTIKLEANFKKDDLTCVKCLTKTLENVPCISTTTTTTNSEL